MKRYFLFTFFIFGLHFSCNEEVGDAVVSDISYNLEPEIEELVYEDFDESVEKKIDHFFSYRNKIGRFNGVVLFADDNKLFQKAYGYSNFRQRDSLDINTSFQLASVSKPVTAISILMLQEKGELSIKDTVKNILPDFPYEKVTIEQLLSHRSGLGNYVYWSEEYWKDQRSLMSNDEMLDLMSEHVPGVYYRANQRYFYNNTNYAVLASIVEKVSGDEFEEFLSDNIFEPLEMNNSFIHSPENIEKFDVATGYKTKRRPYSYFFLDGVYGDKGLYSTVGDLLKLDIALRDGRLLSDSTLVDAYTNRSKSYRKPYGLGWRMTTYSGKQIIYHHGWWRGFKTYFIRSIDDDKTVVVLSNMINGSSLNNKLLLDLMKTKEVKVANVDKKNKDNKS